MTTAAPDPLDVAANAAQGALDAVLDDARRAADAQFRSPAPDHRECCECGGRIPAARLAIVPGALRCARCQCLYEDWAERRGG